MQKCHEVTTIQGKHKMSLDGRVVIVTGAAGGFGQVICSSFLEAGAKVVAIDVSNEALKVIEKQNSTYRKETLITKAVDVSDYFQCQTAVHEAADYFDGVDILINNAGLGMGSVRRDHHIKLVSIDEGDIGKRLDIIGGREKWLIKALNKDKTIIGEIKDELFGTVGRAGLVVKKMKEYKFSDELCDEIIKNWNSLRDDLEKEGIEF